MGTKSLSCPPSAAVDSYLTENPISEADVAESLRGSAHGAVVTFVGRVRDTEDGQRIRSITYEAYEKMADLAIGRLIHRANEKWDIRSTARHRLGEVPVGESAVIVGASGGHREEAFAACRFLIDEIKSKAPIWKVKWTI